MQHKVPFGLLNDMLVEPKSVANGKACGCTCPGCSRPLVAYNQGKVKASYFGHLPGEECAKGVETAIHLAAKDALVQSKRMRLPPLLVGYHGIVLAQRPPLSNRVVELGGPAHYESVEAETSVEVKLPEVPMPAQKGLFEDAEPTSQVLLPSTQLRPDIRATKLGQADCVDWVEIRVTHPVGADKQRLMQQAGMRVIEIDLSRFLSSYASLQDIRTAVVDDVVGKTWVAHPQVPVAVASLLEQEQRETERELLEHFRQEQLAQGSAQSKWARWIAEDDARVQLTMHSGSAQPLQEQLLAALRLKLKLGSSSERWPRHLDLNLHADGGCLVPPRIWLSQLYVDWVQGRPGARFFVSDLVGSVSRKFGVRSPYGHQHLNRSLERRVLPYWQACGLIRLEGADGVVVTEKSSSAT